MNKYTAILKLKSVQLFLLSQNKSMVAEEINEIIEWLKEIIIDESGKV